MSLENRISPEFYRWFLEELLKLLEGQEAAQLETDSHALRGLRLYGQAGQGARSRSVTTRQANLYPRSGQSYPTVMIGGERVALGNTRRQPRRLSRHAVGFFGISRPVLDDYPYQPVARDLTAWFSWHKYSVFGKYDELPGLLAIPHGPRLEVPPYFSGWDPNYPEDFPNRVLLPADPEAKIEASLRGRYIYRTKWMDPANAEIPSWYMRHFLSKPQPFGLAYYVVCYLKSRPEWRRLKAAILRLTRVFRDAKVLT
jgi:hypothetical protein